MSVDDAADDLAAADEDVTASQRRYAYAYLTGLFALVVLAIAASIHFGLVTVDLRVTAAVNAGRVIEALLWVVVGLFGLFTTAQVIIALPGSVLAALARIADNYQIPGNDE